MLKNCILVFAFMLMAHGIDNSSLKTKELGLHQKTYGLVYIVPEIGMKKLEQIYLGPLHEKLTLYGAYDALQRKNIPHITVLHLHTKDKTTPQKMLKMLPKPPAPFTLTIKKFGLVKASKHSTKPWWFDINVLKDENFESIMQYNFKGTKALTPLRDSPLPRVSGYVYQDLSKEAQAQIRDLGVSGLNRVINGKEERMYRPHITLSYSMQDLNPKLQKELLDLADELNGILDEGIAIHFNTISIVELGISGNVMREIYRIDLHSGAVLDITKDLQKAHQKD